VLEPRYTLIKPTSTPLCQFYNSPVYVKKLLIKCDLLYNCIVFYMNKPDYSYTIIGINILYISNCYLVAGVCMIFARYNKENEIKNKEANLWQQISKFLLLKPMTTST